MKKRLLNISDKLKRCIECIENSPKWGWTIQFIKFSMVGVLNTLIDLAVYYLCLNVFKMHYQLATFLGFIISVTNAFALNGFFVFSNGETKTAFEWVKTYFRTVAGYSGTYLLSAFLMWLWVDVLLISDTIAPILRLFVTVPLNYLINKFWTFKKR